MKVEQAHQKLIDSILQKIGRNLFLYQQIEKKWRSQIEKSQITASASPKAGSKPKLEARKLRKSTPMGDLAHSHTKSLYDELSEVELSQTEEELRISISLRFSDANDISKRRKKHLQRLIRNRNNLVHKLAERFDPTSEDNCREFSSRLDEELAVINTELVYLAKISREQTRGLKRIIDYLQSGEAWKQAKKRQETEPDP